MRKEVSINNGHAVPKTIYHHLSTLLQVCNFQYIVIQSRLQSSIRSFIRLLLDKITVHRIIGHKSGWHSYHLVTDKVCSLLPLLTVRLSIKIWSVSLHYIFFSFDLVGKSSILLFLKTFFAVPFQSFFSQTHKSFSDTSGYRRTHFKFTKIVGLLHF